jgi:hypothetical protein
LNRSVAVDDEDILILVMLYKRTNNGEELAGFTAR